MLRSNISPRKVALLLSALSIVAMGATTVACTPRTEKPAENTNPTPVQMSPGEKDVRINVTRDPESYAPDHNNPAVPCGYGAAGTWCW